MRVTRPGNVEEYPMSPAVNEWHQPTSAMGFGNITQQEGYLDALAEAFVYEPSPECSELSPDCGSKWVLFFYSISFI